MILRQARLSDVKPCVEMYAAYSKDDPLLTFSKEDAIESVKYRLMTGAFMCVVEEHSTLLAFLYAERVRLMHSRTDQLQQQYYCSNVTGVKAVKCVKLLHDEMVAYARRKNIPTCVSAASHLDDTFVFTRILEKAGWIRSNGLAIFRVTGAVAQNGPWLQNSGAGMGRVSLREAASPAAP